MLSYKIKMRRWTSRAVSKNCKKKILLFFPSIKFKNSKTIDPGKKLISILLYKIFNYNFSLWISLKLSILHNQVKSLITLSTLRPKAF